MECGYSLDLVQITRSAAGHVTYYRVIYSSLSKIIIQKTVIYEGWSL